MNQQDIQGVMNWLALGSQVLAGGEALWNDLKTVFVNHGVADDTAALDFVVADAARRKAIAEADAAEPTAQ